MSFVVQNTPVSFSTAGGGVIFNVQSGGPPGIQGPPGPSGSSSQVIDVTSSQPITALDNAAIFSNPLATGTVDLDLPAAPSPFAPLTYSFFVAAAQTLAIVAPTGVTIQNGADVTETGGSFYSNTVGNYLNLTLVSATQWIVTGITGIWNFL